MAFKEYRDPLYGFIGVDAIEQRIIDTPEFQRLRHISQLGTSFLVYPSATHTRFEHVLGVLQASSDFYDAVVGSPSSQEKLGWGDAKRALHRRLVRLAGLLHDIGHPPFSHAAEDLFDSGRQHEDYTVRIITETRIGEIIDAEFDKGARERVAAIAVDRATTRDDAFLSELLTGDIASDRLDYLMRDSLHLGVAYGRFDAHRLVRTIVLNDTPDAGPQLAIEDGGLHAVEGFLLARYFMFLEVYYHRTRRILDRHLVDFLREILPGGVYPADLDGFLAWDDHRALAELGKRSADQRTKRLMARQHFRTCFETSDHPEPDEIVLFEWLKSEVGKTFGQTRLHFDEAAKAPYHFEEPPAPVLWRGGFVPITTRSPLVASLKRIDKMRIYAEPEIRDEVVNFCTEFWKKHSRRWG